MLLAIALVAALTGSLYAGDYHWGATLMCSDCHVMHYSQSHGYNSGGGGIWTNLGSDGPYAYLLRNHENDLCLTCHDGQTFAPDVFGTNTGSAVRMAGALNRDDVAPYNDEHGHTLGSTATPPGGTWTPDPDDGLTCVNCHHPHGYAGNFGIANPYRNLSPNSGGGSHPMPDYAVGSNDLTKDVFERVSGGGTHYDISNIDFNEPDQTASAYADWCKSCHTNFHGLRGGPEVGGTATGEWVRHPQSDANIGALTGGHSSKSRFVLDGVWPKVMTATENWQPTNSNDVTDHTPSCFSCHKSHGNQNAFGLLFLGSTLPVTEEGTSGGQYRDTCRQCHSQGGA